MSAAALALPATPQAPELFFSGDSGGATTRYYWVVARFAFGISAISNYTAVTTVATLNSNNKVFINLKPLPGALSYDILRTTTSTVPTGTASIALAIGINGNWVDFGQSLSSYTVGNQGFTPISGSGAVDVTSPQYTTVALTAANIIAMKATPVLILAAPGAGKILVVESIIVSVTRTATAFTGGGVASFQYHTTTSSAPVTGTVPVAQFTGGAGTSQVWLGPAVVATATVIPANEGIDITNITADFAAGTGTAKVFVKSRVVTL